MHICLNVYQSLNACKHIISNIHSQSGKNPISKMPVCWVKHFSTSSVYQKFDNIFFPNHAFSIHACTFIIQAFNHTFDSFTRNCGYFLHNGMPKRYTLVNTCYHCCDFCKHTLACNTFVCVCTETWLGVQVWVSSPFWHWAVVTLHVYPMGQQWILSLQHTAW